MYTCIQTHTQPPPQPHQGIPGQTGGRQVLISTPTPPPQVMYPQPVHTTGQVGIRPPMYPHLATGILPPNLFLQEMQSYGQMQQPPQTYGGTPPQQINLQLQQPTMQIQPLPLQCPYTRKLRGRNTIRIINPDTGDEVKVDSGSSEAPQAPTHPVAMISVLTTASVGASSTENSVSSNRPSEAPQPERKGESSRKQEKAEKVQETKWTEETKVTKRGGADSSLAGPSSLVTEALESATGEKSMQEVEVEIPVQPVQQEKPVSIPAEDLQTTHPPNENISESYEPPDSSSLPISKVDLTSAPPPVCTSMEEPGTKPDIPSATDDKHSRSEPVAAVVASRTETLTDKPSTSEAADSGVQNGPNVEEISGQKIQPHSEVVVLPKPFKQDIEGQSSGPSLPESSRTGVTIEDQLSQPMIGEDADYVGRTELPEEQEEDRTEVVALAETDCDMRMKGEKMGETLSTHV